MVIFLALFSFLHGAGQAPPPVARPDNQTASGGGMQPGGKVDLSGLKYLLKVENRVKRGMSLAEAMRDAPEGVPRPTVDTDRAALRTFVARLEAEWVEAREAELQRQIAEDEDETALLLLVSELI